MEVEPCAYRCQASVRKNLCIFLVVDATKFALRVFFVKDYKKMTITSATFRTLTCRLRLVTVSGKLPVPSPNEDFSSMNAGLGDPHYCGLLMLPTQHLVISLGMYFWLAWQDKESAGNKKNVDLYAPTVCSGSKQIKQNRTLEQHSSSDLLHITDENNHSQQ